MSDTQLKPCPWCGSSIEIIWGPRCQADCPKCGIVREFGGDYDTAVRKWNTRATEGNGDVEALVDELFAIKTKHDLSAAENETIINAAAFIAGQGQQTSEPQYLRDMKELRDQWNTLTIEQKLGGSQRCMQACIEASYGEYQPEPVQSAPTQAEEKCKCRYASIPGFQDRNRICTDPEYSGWIRPEKSDTCSRCGHARACHQETP